MYIALSVVTTYPQNKQKYHTQLNIVVTTTMNASKEAQECNRQDSV